ncbi:MAG TPA: c-type cytochrome, partial [Paracoccaceae bacterium]|nr:c-type cytochrome [Paracoccaceae bacterium]
ATGGNLVFQGTPDGRFTAYNAADGEELWSFQQERGIMAGPISYRADGVQYVAVLAGYGGSMGMASQTDWMRRPPPNGMLLVFRIGGTGELAPLPPVAARPYTASEDTFTPEQIAMGQGQYFAFCTICHNGPVNPDLLRSPVATDAAAWNAVVMDGILAQRGMISFTPWINAEQSEAIRAYVLTEAARRQSLEQQ